MSRLSPRVKRSIRSRMDESFASHTSPVRELIAYTIYIGESKNPVRGTQNDAPYKNFRYCITDANDKGF